ncbi:hypothetical protein [Aggregatibacter actinomycetemcomitans]|uniref:hypothetical protein n=1 Tax=Aggregatibacter actinomycetemcomitans TaxID=714 RepID=UPI001E624B4F|nr:hypothetical protein [Aggregatibacter actinomycetemcomitans]
MQKKTGKNRKKRNKKNNRFNTRFSFAAISCQFYMLHDVDSLTAYCGLSVFMTKQILKNSAKILNAK